MPNLELKIPPGVVALVLGAGMWLASSATPGFNCQSLGRVWIAFIGALVGACLIIAGGVLFRRSKTTLNPMRPGRTSSLVSSGVFRFTRNPMYLGGLLLLVAWGIALGSLLAVAISFLFVPYMNRFQIGPEERILRELLGREYEEYLREVRRWI